MSTNTRTAAVAVGVALSTALTATLISGTPLAHAATGSSDPQRCGTYTGRGCAPSSARVDLVTPVFSHPTEITNPMFPISRLQSAVLLGHVDGKRFRTETTLLPGTGSVSIDGQRVPVLLSQYMAYLGGHLEEVALDRYALADDGSVWYLGEDVFDYRRGTVAETEGTWLAGRDGPAAMIMPGQPKVGDVFRTENVPGVVFEEVTVTRTGQSVSGPLGPVAGAMVMSELHSDGTRESKVFAPGYGEFRTSGGGDLEAMAMAVPTDASSTPMPPRLATMATATTGILEAARLREWAAARSALRILRTGWGTVRTGQPWRVAKRLDRDLAPFTAAVRHRRPHATTQRALKVAQSVLDLQLRYRSPTAVDTERFVLWTQQLRVHAAAGNRSGVTGDVAVLEWIRDRLTGSLSEAALEEVDTRLAALRIASDARNLPAAADHAARLASRIRMLST
jgi:hypothetical protein